MLDKIKEQLKLKNIDAWIIYDFGLKNQAYTELFGKSFTTRRVFVVISQDKNIVISHKIDTPAIKNSKIASQFQFVEYLTWQDLENTIKDTISNFNTVAMEISDDGSMPKMSYVDYGTVCLIKKYVKNVVSSLDMFQSITAPFSGKSLSLHKTCAKHLNSIKDLAFNKIKEDIKSKGHSNEYEIQQFILNKFKELDLVTDSAPIVAISQNATSPHYEPTFNCNSDIKNGDLVLIDLWAKCNDKEAVFADITWMGYVGSTIPLDIKQAFDAVKGAIDKALKYLEDNLPHKVVYGYEVDDICYNYLKELGYKDCIMHRSGHSISKGDSDHGVGVNIDNFETHDTRPIINNVMFSLEPSIYNQKFGLREEINVYILDNKPVVFTPRQKEIVKLVWLKK